MKKFLVIGNPISHSLSPKLHNYWFEKNKIDAQYEKKSLEEHELSIVIENLRNDDLSGINVTTPFKQKIIKYLDELTLESKDTNSVNTIFKKNNKIIGHNTDIAGFELAVRKTKFELYNKKALILGSGGVVSSIIYALKKLDVSDIFLMNRTIENTNKIKERFKYINVIKWGEKYDFDIIVNATSVGLRETDKLEIDYESFGINKLFFDLIYNPKKTYFLKKAEQFSNFIENGAMMFIYQAHQSFTIWHNIMPEIDDDTIKMIKYD